MRRLLMGAAITIPLAASILTYTLSEGALHIYGRTPPSADLASEFARATSSTHSDLEARTPDGASGGALVTYGVQESADVHTWADAAYHVHPYARLYGLGVSLAASWPLLRFAFAPYTRLRYGTDLRQASPAAAIRITTTPVLLIHGAEEPTSRPATHRFSTP